MRDDDGPHPDRRLLRRRARRSRAAERPRDRRAAADRRHAARRARPRRAPRPNGALLAERIMLPAFNLRGIRGRRRAGARLQHHLDRGARVVRLPARARPDARARARAGRGARARGRATHVVADTPDAATSVAHPKIARMRLGERLSGAARADGRPVLARGARAVDRATAPTGRRCSSAHVGRQRADATCSRRCSACRWSTLPIANHDNNQHAANENLRRAEPLGRRSSCTLG